MKYILLQLTDDNGYATNRFNILQSHSTRSFKTKNRAIPAKVSVYSLIDKTEYPFPDAIEKLEAIYLEATYPVAADS